MVMIIIVDIGQPIKNSFMWQNKIWKIPSMVNVITDMSLLDLTANIMHSSDCHDATI